MKYLCLTLFFILLSCKPTAGPIVFHESKIDKLFTEEGVEKFVSKNTSFRDFTVMKAGDYKGNQSDSSFCKKTADSLGINKSFYKTDFDHNGYTDLLVSGKGHNFIVIAILNYPGNRFKTHYFYDGIRSNCFFTKIDTIGVTPVINYYAKNDRAYDDTVSSLLASKILIYHSGAFVEYNSDVKAHLISKIEYQTFPCFGTCPIFNLVIEMNGKGLLDAQEYNTNHNSIEAELEGKYNSIIRPSRYKEITELLNYIDFTNLLDNYAVRVTDLPGCRLKITYDNGKTKEIHDYGLQGTYGLKRVYSLLSELRFNQVWKN